MTVGPYPFAGPALQRRTSNSCRWLKKPTRGENLDDQISNPYPLPWTNPLLRSLSCCVAAMALSLVHSFAVPAAAAPLPHCGYPASSSELLHAVHPHRWCGTVTASALTAPHPRRTRQRRQRWLPTGCIRCKARGWRQELPDLFFLQFSSVMWPTNWAPRTWMQWRGGLTLL
jgi:hypothetical protein